MFRQASLFGGFAKKEPFFKAIHPRPPESDGYFAVVEAMWTIDRSGRRREDFLKSAQDSWREKYRDNPVERKSLLAKAESIRTAKDEGPSPFIVTMCADEVSERRCAAAAAHCSRTESETQPSSAIPMDCLFHALAVDKSAFLTADVQGMASVVQLLRDVAELHYVFDEERRTYGRMTTYRWKRSLISRGLEEVDLEVAEVQALMKELSKLVIPTTVLLTAAGSQLINLKMKKLTDLCAKLTILRLTISKTLKRMQVRNCQMRCRGLKSRGQDIQFSCYNPPELTWEESVDFLKEASERDQLLGAPLTVQQLLLCAEKFQECNALHLERLLSDLELVEEEEEENGRFCDIVAEQLLKYLPVMGVRERSSNRWVLVNMHEFSLMAHGDTFADLLLLDVEDNVLEEQQGEEPPQAAEVFNHLPRQKPGRKPLHMQYPEIVTIVTDFIQLHGFAAESRRRSTVGNAMGVTLAELKAHVLSKVPSLANKGISRTVIHELLVAPRRKTRNAQRYHGLVDARVPGKDNSLHKSHMNSHYAFAQANYVRECCAEFADECHCLSCDDMNKLHVGTLAVSRYHQVRHFFPTEDRPVYGDHDFPFRNSKIIPSGYMVLEKKEGRGRKVGRQRRLRSRSTSVSKQRHLEPGQKRRSRSYSPLRQRATGDAFRLDKLHRLHREVPHTGTVYVLNRATKFHQASSVAHASDLASLLLHQLPHKAVVSVLVDGGPDFNPRHVKNLLAFGRLWRDMNLDCLMVTCHAPGQSPYNPVEHAWSVLANALTGVTFPNHLPGESPPEAQDIPEADKRRKESVIFDQAIDQLGGYWKEKSFDGFPVVPMKVECLEAEEKYRDNNKLDEYVNASSRKVIECPDLKELNALHKFLCKHAVRTTYHCLFAKCSEGSCPDCSLHPVRASRFMTFLRQCGGRMFTPTPSPYHDGHYLTYHECCLQQDLHRGLLEPDASIPSGKPQRCQAGCKYVFTSQHDEDKHHRQVHGGGRKRQHKPTDGEQGNSSTQPAQKATCHRCTYVGCVMAFATRYQLTVHKTATGHTLPRGRPKKQ